MTAVWSKDRGLNSKRTPSSFKARAPCARGDWSRGKADVGWKIDQFHTRSKTKDMRRVSRKVICAGTSSWVHKESQDVQVCCTTWEHMAPPPPSHRPIISEIWIKWWTADVERVFDVRLGPNLVTPIYSQALCR